MNDGCVEAFRHEVAEEKAAALGLSGKRLQHALAMLRGHDTRHAPGDLRRDARRERLLWDLTERVEAFIVHREACGLRDSHYVLEFYAVPDEVVTRIGAKRPAETL